MASRPSGMLHDISVLVREGTPEWPGDVQWSCGWTARVADGAAVNLSHVTSSPHVGTHADAPLHVRDGWPASETLPLDAFIGPVLLLDVGGDTSEELSPLRHDPRLTGANSSLLRTVRSIADGVLLPETWPALSASMRALAARCVGF